MVLFRCAPTNGVWKMKPRLAVRGLLAAAIVSAGKETGRFTVPVKAAGGDLSVSFEKKDAGTAEQIVLTGAAQFVFKGNIEV